MLNFGAPGGPALGLSPGAQFWSTQEPQPRGSAPVLNFGAPRAPALELSPCQPKPAHASSNQPKPDQHAQTSPNQPTPNQTSSNQLVCAGLVRFGLVWFGVSWFGLVCPGWAGLGWFELDCAGLDWHRLSSMAEFQSCVLGLGFWAEPSRAEPKP